MERSTALGVILGAALGMRFLMRRRGGFDLRGRTAIVTGGSRGLGLAIARELGKRGAKLVIASRDAARVDEACRQLGELGYEAFGVACDVRIPMDVERLVREAKERFGRIDVLVNDAGEIEVGPLETMTREDFARSIDTHVWGPLSTSLAVVPEMRARGEGRIANIASIGGLLPIPHLSAYSASKAGLVGLSGALGAELAKDGIYVSTICPGLMVTGSPRNAFFKSQHRAEYAWFSLGDALPFTSMSAERAAKRIVKAIERGEPLVVFGVQARLAHLAYAVFPNLVSRMLSTVTRLLPAPGGIGAEMAYGYESGSSVSPSAATVLDDRAAARNNER